MLKYLNYFLTLARKSIIILSLVPYSLVGYAASPQKPTTISVLRANIDHTLYYVLKFISDIAALFGFILFFIGIYTLYTGVSKQAAGNGKSPAMSLLYLFSGAFLIALPILYGIVSSSVGGDNSNYTVGDTASDGQYSNILADN